MKKIILLLAISLFGIVYFFKYPPIKAEQKETYIKQEKIANINFDSLSKSKLKELIPIKNKIIKGEQLEKEVKILKSKLLQKNTVQILRDTIVKKDTVYITDSIKGQNYKTNIFGKKRKINK